MTDDEIYFKIHISNMCKDASQNVNTITKIIC